LAFLFLQSGSTNAMAWEFTLGDFYFAFGATLLTSIVLVATQRWHGHMSLDNAFGVQNHHSHPTPRIGGVAIALGLCVAWVIAAPDVRKILGPMLLAGIPAFAFGLAEDLTKKVGVRPRLLATMFSGVLGWYFTGIAIQNTGLMPLDWLLGFLPLAVLFTAFAVGGFANAINIIDGFNGLASGAVAIMSAALGLISLQVGDAPLATVCFIVTLCALGFGLVNWPLGKMFLGDGGAYLLGFVLGWLSVLLPMRNTEVTSWAPLVVCAYPVLEVLFTILRRRKRQYQHPGQPDKGHLHHFIHRRVVRMALGHLSDKMQNSLTSPLCWFFTAVPAIAAVMFPTNTPMLILFFCIATLGYSMVYARLTQFGWCFRALTLQRKPGAEKAG
jgi:UDP-N-acetylmuramyl pentapeptide phosphotransferase/UDP-N-acetylglucosamine-1-phosphate transferase